MEKSASQLRMEADYQRLKEERLLRMGIPPEPKFEVLKNRDVDMVNPPIVDYIYRKHTLDFTFKDDPAILAKYGNPKIKALLDDAIKDAALVKATALANAKDALDAAFSQSIWNSTSSLDSSPLGTIPSHKWVTVELPLYVGQQKNSEVMELMEQIHNRHGDDDTGSLYKVQDAFDGFVNAHDNRIRQGIESGTWSTQFEFWLRLPSENYANLLSSWPRERSAGLGSNIVIRVTARVLSLFFVGYDLEENIETPLRVKLHIKCQSGHENRVEQVLSKLLATSGTFYVVGAVDLEGNTVETFEISKLGFVDVLDGKEQILLN